MRAERASRHSRPADTCLSSNSVARRAAGWLPPTAWERQPGRLLASGSGPTEQAARLPASHQSEQHRPDRQRGRCCPGAVARGAGSGLEIVAPPHESSSGRRRCSDARSSPVLRAGQAPSAMREATGRTVTVELLMRSASLSSMRSTPRSAASPTRAANTRPYRGLLPGD
jgi:hypothetical protein